MIGELRTLREQSLDKSAARGSVSLVSGGCGPAHMLYIIFKKAGVTSTVCDVCRLYTAFISFVCVHKGLIFHWLKSTKFKHVTENQQYLIHLVRFECILLHFYVMLLSNLTSQMQIFYFIRHLLYTYYFILKI